MAATPVKMVRAELTATLTTKYTVPAGATAIVTNIVISNFATASAAVWIKIGGLSFIKDTVVPAKGVLTFDIAQVLAAGEAIEVAANAVNLANVHISGVEVTA